MAKSFIRSSAALAMADFSKKALLALTVLVCARLVPKETFGNYMFLMSFYQIFSVVAGAGIPNILVRQIAGDKEWRPERLSGSVLARSLYAIPAGGLMFIFFFVGRYSVSFLPALGTLCVLIFLRAATENAISIFQGREEALTCAKISLVQSAVTLVSTLVVCLTTKRLFPLVACHAIGALCSTLFAAYLFHRRGLALFTGLHRSMSAARKLLAETRWMNGAALISSAYNRCDVLLLEGLASADAVATYSAPYRVLDLAQILPQGVMGIVLARICREERKDSTQIDQGRILTILLLTSLLLIVVTTVLSPIVVPLLLGKQYIASVHVLEILIWATPFMFFNAVLIYNFIALRAERFIFYGCVAALIFNLTTNLILIPRYSYLAAAASTVGTECILLSANLLFCHITGVSIPIRNASETMLSFVAALGGVLIWSSQFPYHIALGAFMLGAAAMMAVNIINRLVRRAPLPAVDAVSGESCKW